MRLTWLAAVCVCFLMACAPTANFWDTEPGYRRARRAPAQVELYPDGRQPPAGAIDVGFLETECGLLGLACNEKTDIDRVLQTFQEAGARLGLDGIRAVRCSPNYWQMDPGTCEGIGFIVGRHVTGDREKN
jgi:hypothetical protein